MALGNINNLPQSLTIDGVDFAPCAYLVADDATAGTWMSRHDVSKALSVVGTGAAPTIGNATAITNTAVKYAAAKYHQASDTTWGQLGTDDFALEIIYRHGTGSKVLAATFGATPGFEIFINNGNLTFYASDAAAATFLSSIAMSSDAWHHVICLCDRSENFYWYVNGAYSTSAPFTPAASLVSTYPITVGIRPDGIWALDREIAHFGLWSPAGTPFPGSAKNRTYFDRIARERFAIVAGIQDQKAGAHTFTRATSAYVDRYVSATKRQLFAVSAGWPRVCNRKDSAGTEVTGYLSELQYVNDFLYSEDATQWARVRCTISATPITAPDGTLTADGIISDAGNNTHYVNLECAADASQHVFSCWLKAGAQNWARMDIHTVANAYAYFDVSSSAGAMGTVGADIDSYGIEPWGDGWYRCWIEYTGAAPAHDHHIHTANANDGQTWDSPGSVVDLYVWGAQHENAGAVAPTSYIKTAAAKVTRNKDQLTYDVRLPIVGDINSLSQSLTIGGTDYAPCAYLVADDVNVSTGAWASRHNATKALAYAGAGTNPTPAWANVSRANKSIKYWASNYHQAADATWGQITTGDAAWECIFVAPPDGWAGGPRFISARSAVGGWDISLSSSGAALYLNDGTNAVQLSGGLSGGYKQNTVYHLFLCMDKSEALYGFLNGVYLNSAAIGAFSGSPTTVALQVGALVGASPWPGQFVQFGIWDLTANPWPGAATNQATMGAIARARFNQLFRYTSCRLDADILHPAIDRTVAATFVDAGASANDIMSLGVATTDVATSVAAANAGAQWSMTASTTDIAAGVKRKLSVKARADVASLNVDNASEATDTSCEVPAGMTRLHVGQKIDGTLQPTCLIANVKLARSDR
jgi:hypothetical protein